MYSTGSRRRKRRRRRASLGGRVARRRWKKWRAGVLIFYNFIVSFDFFISLCIECL
jgi:hypothetical protein